MKGLGVLHKDANAAFRSSATPHAFKKWGGEWGWAARQGAISTEERLQLIRNQFSLNMKQLADVMHVGRPAVYKWLEGAVLRRAQLARLKQLHDLAAEWQARSAAPVGKYLILPLQDGVSLAALLKAPEMDVPAIRKTMAAISSKMRALQESRRKSDYRSAAELMAARGIEPAAQELQRQRVQAV